MGCRVERVPLGDSQRDDPPCLFADLTTQLTSVRSCWFVTTIDSARRKLNDPLPHGLRFPVGWWKLQIKKIVNSQPKCRKYNKIEIFYTTRRERSSDWVSVLVFPWGSMDLWHIGHRVMPAAQT
jgi:hypothetical protein